MEKKSKHNGFVWPIILILVGALFLMNNLGIIDNVTWDSIWQLWPLIFIAIGLDGLLRRSEIVGPVIMFGLGGVFLLSNFGWLGWNAWDALWRLWPLLIIAIGLEIMVGRRSPWLSALVVLLILAMLMGLLWMAGIGFAPLGGQSIESESIYQELGDASRAEVSLSPAVGQLLVYELGDSKALIEGEVSIGRSRQIWESYKVQGNTATYSLNTRNNFPFFGSGWDWQLGLDPDVPIELEASMAAGDMDLELADITLSGLNASQAVGDLLISLPAGESINGDISQAIGQIIVYVPSDVSVRIEVSKALSSLTIPSDFDRQGDYYYSPGYEAAEMAIDLDISQAIGSIVVRYNK
ncbi:MAG: hypothetical protein ISR58_01085 [Anaerolineales bacterium]|nr:hypothetical protein [Chloroflexota bacterium]MBL6979758.1 hypothetical protein [Anaerolineales bacterium]